MGRIHRTGTVLSLPSSGKTVFLGAVELGVIRLGVKLVAHLCQRASSLSVLGCDPRALSCGLDGVVEHSFAVDDIVERAEVGFSVHGQEGDRWGEGGEEKVVGSGESVAEGEEEDEEGRWGRWSVGQVVCAVDEQDGLSAQKQAGAAIWGTHTGKYRPTLAVLALRIRVRRQRSSGQAPRKS